MLMNKWDDSMAEYSIRLDSVLCPPSAMMLAFSKDRKNFQVFGQLKVYNFKLTQDKKELHIIKH
jgi:hypothetical protein